MAVLSATSQTGATAHVPSLAKTLLAWAGVTLVTAPIGYMSMFSTFRVYDDEGSFLVLLRDYLSGHPLLTPSTSYYGPFYYEVMGGVFKLLGVAPTNDSGRFVTLAIWLAAGLLGGVVAYRLTRNLWLSLVSQLLTFILLTALIQEPMATYGLISLLLLGLVLAATFTQTQPRASAAAIGAIVGALCLVKINVGAFAVLAVTFAWAAGLAPQWRRFALPATAGVMTLAPFVLMAGLLSRGWVIEYALLVSLSAAAVGIACLPALRVRLTPPPTSWLILGVAVLAAISLAGALVTGTHPADLWDGLVLTPYRLPQLFTLPVSTNPAADVWAVLSIVACVAFARAGASRGIPDLARVAAGLFILVSILLLPSSVFLFGLTLAWIAIQGPGDQFAYHRLLVPALAVMESLQAFPVAGTQLALTALLVVPVGATVLNDGLAGLRTRSAARFARTPLVFAAAALALNAFFAGSQFAATSPSGLPGAEFVRMPAQQSAQLRLLVSAIDRGCSSFLTYPGMNSFYVWTGQQPPSDLRYGVWYLAPNAADQRATVSQLQTRSRLCVVKNQSVIEFWSQGRPVPRQPVVDFIDQNFTDGGTYGDYQLLVER